MDSRYPLDEPTYHYGSVYRECYCDEFAVLTKARTKQLKTWLKGTEEGDLCAGSVKRTNRLR